MRATEVANGGNDQADGAGRAARVQRRGAGVVRVARARERTSSGVEKHEQWGKPLMGDENSLESFDLNQLGGIREG